MLKDKEGLLLTEDETYLIEQATIDNETGNHLLRPRSDEYWAMRKEIYEATKAENPTDRQSQILEYMKQCSDYFYWKKLPDDKKLFIEVEEEE